MTRIVAVPQLSLDQRREALKKATSVRMARRAFKEEVAAGRYEIAAVIALAKSDETLAGIKVSDLLVSLPGIGPKRVVSLMTEAGIAPSRRMRGIGEHQVARLVARLTP